MSLIVQDEANEQTIAAVARSLVSLIVVLGGDTKRVTVDYGGRSWEVEIRLVTPSDLEKGSM